MIIVILGMHRSRTSLVSHMCSVMGVHMGDRTLGTHPSQPHGHWEDVEFYELNKHILDTLGGVWDRPPSVQSIRDNVGRFRDRASGLVKKKSARESWGWKDPRTCLTLPVFWPYIKDREPMFIFTERRREDIVDSLIRRNKGTPEKWNRLIDLYTEGLDWARDRGLAEVPSIVMDTDLLVANRMHALTETERLAKFLGVSGPLARQAIGVIDFGK